MLNRGAMTTVFRTFAASISIVASAGRLFSCLVTLTVIGVAADPGVSVVSIGFLTFKFCVTVSVEMIVMVEFVISLVRTGSVVVCTCGRPLHTGSVRYIAVGFSTKRMNRVFRKQAVQGAFAFSSSSFSNSIVTSIGPV